jgi:hypothetical protein
MILKKEMEESQPLWTRLLALSGFLLMMGAAAVFPKLGDHSASVATQVVSGLRTAPKPSAAEVAWLFRSYAKVTPAPAHLLMTGPELREKPLG